MRRRGAVISGVLLAPVVVVSAQDRILFGEDRCAPEESDLPDEVLRRVYCRNALDVIPASDPSPFPAP